MKINLVFRNLVLLILLFIMGVVCTVSLKSFYQGNIIEILSNDLNKDDVVLCIQTADIELSDLLYISNDTFISKVLSENTRGIYFSSKYFYKLPVVEGRFFNYNDFDKNNNYVVVGQNLKPYLYTKNNKTYFNYFNVEYEVIGILGYDKESMLDNIVLFNLVNIFDEAPQKTDIFFGNNHELLLENIKQLQLDDSIAILDIPHSGITRIWSAPHIFITIVYITYICCIISILFLIYLKSYYYDNYLKIFKILGFNKNFIYNNFFLMESMMYIVVFSVSVLLTLSIFVEKLYINKYFVLSLLVISIINCSIFIFFNLFILNSKIKKFYYR